jgi:SAM-dependent methyltransferase
VSLGPVEVYEAGLRAAERGSTEGWRVRYADGGASELPLRAWTGGTRPGDLGLLDRCAGPTLDLGCGPGRLTAQLAARGVPALGVDVAPYAVTLARGRGGTALHRDLFDPLPGEGRWHRLLLADGNLGIGGDPAALLRRCAGLLHPDGILLCETDRPGTGVRRTRVRLEPPLTPPSAWFPWAQVGAEALPVLGSAAGLAVAGGWAERGRWFAVLAPARSGAAAKAAMPSAKPIRVDHPSSSRARAADAVTCRTSPSR